MTIFNKTKMMAADSQCSRPEVESLEGDQPAFVEQASISTCLAKNAFVIEGDIANTLILFAHGAGANGDSDFMTCIAQGLAANGVQVMRFNFPYMQANALDGKRRPPDKAPKLLAYFYEMLLEARQLPHIERIFLMGKSMGGRMAATLACDPQVAKQVSGVICLGYPFVPLKGGEPRLAPLNECQVPVLVVQGERDKFGDKARVATWPLNDNVTFHWLTDGDHSFVPRKSSGTSEAANLGRAIALITAFVR